MPKITPFLWFDGKAEEAANFYVSIFKNSKLEEIRRWGAGGEQQPCGWLKDKSGLTRAAQVSLRSKNRNAPTGETKGNANG